ncbi:hypothetical protein F2Q69_00035732 [Brassica cretica]|uniref:Uncharacterized protein n=1 Tax=Brassica cretica TaxID=69181 RepID=A0A8S9SPG0_BRACR|nr:hypothetical protein F2Q69_00035732 [Brassica cretica]
MDHTNTGAYQRYGWRTDAEEGLFPPTTHGVGRATGGQVTDLPNAVYAINSKINKATSLAPDIERVLNAI